MERLPSLGDATIIREDTSLPEKQQDQRKNIRLGPMYGILAPGPAITISNDGTFTLFRGCSCYKENRILTGQVDDFRRPIKLEPAPQTATYCVQINNTETNYLRILRAAETYHIRNNIEYMNLRTAAGESGCSSEAVICKK